MRSPAAFLAAVVGGCRRLPSDHRTCAKHRQRPRRARRAPVLAGRRPRERPRSGRNAERRRGRLPVAGRLGHRRIALVGRGAERRAQAGGIAFLGPTPTRPCPRCGPRPAPASPVARRDANDRRCGPVRSPRVRRSHRHVQRLARGLRVLRRRATLLGGTGSLDDNGNPIPGLRVRDRRALGGGPGRSRWRRRNRATRGSAGLPAETGHAPRARSGGVIRGFGTAPGRSAARSRRRPDDAAAVQIARARASTRRGRARGSASARARRCLETPVRQRLVVGSLRPAA